MERSENLIHIHMCDDDPDDRLLFEDAIAEANLINDISFTEDGQQLMDFLNRQGDYKKLHDKELPDIILLDLNMPRKDGREALKDIKDTPNLRHIPIVILTTSKHEEDIFKSYNLGASSYIAKPVTFEKLVDLVKQLSNYWFKIVKLPENS
ncbi:response regulator [Pleionea mediterranea]|uniref:Response regulator receiver domain-containing protein n=1 Tax=Pleionea mediterranea TaxID=523701 RepID=A0A316FYG7_9GAMM|nr:response regulator [Pleionea mediterranea]PWK53744.1 response regulator receiver domain-containing protein [Pleionea mediterranea]